MDDLSPLPVILSFIKRLEWVITYANHKCAVFGRNHWYGLGIREKMEFETKGVMGT